MDGIIVINKPKGCTSHDVVNKVKKIFGTKVGHTGTLDPNATGVLPLLIGQATKLSAYLIEHNKEYIAAIKLGIKTDTADAEGNVIEEKEVAQSALEKENVDKILKSFLGNQLQTPPMYSAIKVKGKKLYEYARQNQKIEINKRQIQIYDIQLLKIDKKEKEILFKVKCSKGTYIRSLCEDISEKLQTVGYMKELQRTVVGNFTIENSISIEELEHNIENKKFILNKIITIEDFFKNHDKINLNEYKLNLFLNGTELTYKFQDGLYRIYDEIGKFIGIGSVKNNLLKRAIIIANVNTI